MKHQGIQGLPRCVPLGTTRWSDERKAATLK